MFGYGVVVVFLFLEWVPLMRTHVPLTRIDVEDPHITRWVEAMARHSGGEGPRVT